MTVQLNHTIIAAKDRDASARFLAEILGLPPPLVVGHFAVVKVGDTSLDFVGADAPVSSRHFAFLVSEIEFDQIFGRIRERGLAYWADPFRKQPGEINGWDDGRGVYFDDPSGHLLEVITRPYGSGGTKVERPHPLFARSLDPSPGADRDSDL
jgi:catechol 2,3-dioxygenase-like lactoylglutathione lyase family enzyme